jgi:chemotaxis protein histidine kinase CheA
MHMIRNAIDHGIESRDERVLVGKPPSAPSR